MHRILGVQPQLNRMPARPKLLLRPRKRLAGGNRNLSAYEIRAEDPRTSYPMHGTLDVQALAEAVESALGGGTLDDGKSPAELNAANDG